MCVIQLKLEWSNFKLSYFFICFYDCHFEFMFYFFNVVHFVTKLLCRMETKKLFTLCLISYIYFKLFMLHFFLLFWNFCVKFT